jgi:hypothetical protein
MGSTQGDYACIGTFPGAFLNRKKEKKVLRLFFFKMLASSIFF